jgi:hypothetical protein
MIEHEGMRYREEIHRGIGMRKLVIEEQLVIVDLRP